MSELLKTPLNAAHRALGARMVDFGGWDMPVQYTGIIDEHTAVRNAAGLFDVSHMGELEVLGPQALDLVNFVTTNDASKLDIGQVHYSGLMYETGCFVDDILVHKVADTSSASTPRTRTRTSPTSSNTTASTAPSRISARHWPRSPCRVPRRPPSFRN